jgi:hypothetical protein
MTCKKYRELFSEYLDGDLDTRERRRFEDHLEECEQCAVEFAGFRKVVALTATLPPLQSSPGFERTLRAKLAETENVAGRSALFGRRAVAVFGAVCLLLAAAFVVYVSQKDHQSEDERMQILIGRETVPMVHSYTDENILTNFVMPSVPMIEAGGSLSEDVGTTVSEDWQESRTFVLPSVMGEQAAQDRPDTNYVIKRISLIGASDETMDF